MGAMCKILGHKWRMSWHCLSVELNRHNLKFVPNTYTETYDKLKNMGISPEVVYKCERCGKEINGPQKFIDFYKFGQGEYEMTRFRNYILAPNTINEAAYQGNIGFEELSTFYQIATDDEINQMEVVLRDGDWEEFTRLIHKVVGTKLR